MKKVEFTNSKGMKLSGFFEEPENYKETVVLVHGLNGNKDEWHGFPELVEAGYRTFSFDFIGRGESEGEYSDIDLENSIDCLNSAIDFVGGEVIVVARSFGAMVAIAANNPKVKKLVVCAVGYKFDSVDYEKVKEEGFFVISNPNHKYSFELLKQLKEANILEKVKEIKVPLLVIASNGDELVPIKQAKEIYENAETEKKFVELFGLSHEFYIKEPAPKIVEEVLNFLNEGD